MKEIRKLFDEKEMCEQSVENLGLDSKNYGSLQVPVSIYWFLYDRNLRHERVNSIYHERIIFRRVSDNA